ncbi:MAG: class I SAM-dependent methyltransferase [bacterium]|nr:class I SAM-dependent methyltransferase [bacterium]
MKKNQNESLFNERAKNWEDSPRKILAGEIAKGMKENLDFSRELWAMDYGAGTGLVTMELAPLVREITAMDISSGMLGVLREKIAGLKEEINITTKEFDIGSGSEPGESYDIIVSSMTLHHIKDTENAVKKWFAMLNPGGQIGIADLDKEDGSFHPDNSGVEHFGFDREDLARVFQDAGFKNVSTKIVYEMKRPDKDRKYPIFLITGKKE